MPTQTGTLKAGCQLYIDIANGDASTTFDYSVSGATVRDNGKAWKSDRVVGPFTEDITFTVTYTGSPSIYKVQPSGRREYTAETLPDPENLVAGEAVVVDGQELAVSEGIWQGKRRTVFVKTGLESDSAFNTQQIQTALNLGGIVEIIGEPGKVYVDKSVNTVACLVHPSFTTLIIPDNIRITQASNQNVPLIVSKSTADYFNGQAKLVTLGWTSGFTFTVTCENHGKMVGDYVSIYKTDIANADPIQFAGTFQVLSVGDSNTFTLRLYRTVSSAPTNTTSWFMLSATEQAVLSGGQWDYNKPSNNTATNKNTLCMIYNFVALCDLNPGTFFNTKKYCLLLGCDYATTIQRCNGDISVGSDGIKIYGPAVGTRVGKVTGAFYDDCISVMPYEKPPYDRYRLSWGDTLDIYTDQVHATSETAGSAVIYPSTVPFGRVDNVRFGDVHSNARAKIVGQSSQSGDVGFVDFGTIRPRGGNTWLLTCEATSVGSLKVKLVTDDVSLTTQGGLSLDNSFSYKRFELDLDIRDTNAAHSHTGWITMDGQGSIFKVTGRLDVNSAWGDFFMTPIGTGNFVREMVLDSVMTSGGMFVRTGPTTQQCITIKGCQLNGGTTVTNQAVSQTTRVRLIDNTVRASTKLLRNGSASVTTMVFDNGGNYLESGSVATDANGGTISAWS